MDDESIAASSEDDQQDTFRGMESLPGATFSTSVVNEDEHDLDDDDDDDDDEAEVDSRTEELNRTEDDNDSVTDGDETDDDDDRTAKSNVSEEAEKQPNAEPSPPKRGRKRRFINVSRKGRTPSVKGLTIPFRTVKKAMKLDPDTPIVQNEGAIMATFAVELFLQKLAKNSFENAKNRGRNTVRYEDIAEARTNSTNLNFLEKLLP